MSKIEKLIERLLSEPRDFSWDELTRVLSHYGYRELKTGKTGGSRRKFTDHDNVMISLHKPHPSNILKQYQLRDIIAFLKEKGEISE